MPKSAKPALPEISGSLSKDGKTLTVKIPVASGNFAVTKSGNLNLAAPRFALVRGVAIDGCPVKIAGMTVYADAKSGAEQAAA